MIRLLPFLSILILTLAPMTAQACPGAPKGAARSCPYAKGAARSCPHAKGAKGCTCPSAQGKGQYHQGPHGRVRYSKGRGGKGGHHTFKPLQVANHVEQMHLDPAVTTAIREDAYKAKKAHIEAKAQMRVAHLEIRRLMGEDKVDEKAIMKQVDLVTKHHSDAMKAALSFRITTMNRLTPEQRKDLRRAMHKQGKGNGRGKGQPVNDPWH